VGRVVFASLCDKLFDLDEKLAIVPPARDRVQVGGDNKVASPSRSARA
jgi:peptide/nickel transport system substrate-binding protein